MASSILAVSAPRATTRRTRRRRASRSGPHGPGALWAVCCGAVAVWIFFACERWGRLARRRVVSPAATASLREGGTVNPHRPPSCPV
eukprot:1218074-Prymnesium_polylepis.3